MLGKAGFYLPEVQLGGGQLPSSHGCWEDSGSYRDAG